MARTKSGTAKKSSAKKRTPPPMPKADYGVDYVAEALGVEPFTARQKLRAAGIKKSGRIYDFGTKKAADEVVKQLKAIKEENKSKRGGAKKSTAAKKTTRRPRKKKTESDEE